VAKRQKDGTFETAQAVDDTVRTAKEYVTVVAAMGAAATLGDGGLSLRLQALANLLGKGLSVQAVVAMDALTGKE